MGSGSGGCGAGFINRSCRWVMTDRAGAGLVSEEEVSDNQGGRHNLDLEIRPAVAIGIAGKDAVGETQFAVDAAKIVVADELELLVSVLVAVGVDRRQVDPVALAVLELLDDVVIGANLA